MKKLVTAVLLICPVFALAQSRGDRIVVRDAWAITAKTPNTTKVKKNAVRNRRQIKIIDEKVLRKAIQDSIERKDLEIQRRKQILKAIFLGGKFPWESEEDYKLRLQLKTTPQGQPTK